MKILAHVYSTSYSPALSDHQRSSCDDKLLPLTHVKYSQSWRQKEVRTFNCEETTEPYYIRPQADADAVAMDPQNKKTDTEVKAESMVQNVSFLTTDCARHVETAVTNSELLPRRETAATDHCSGSQ